MSTNLPTYAERLRDALAPRTPAEERTCDYLATVTNLQADALLAMIARIVADAYDRGHHEGRQDERERSHAALKRTGGEIDGAL